MKSKEYDKNGYFVETVCDEEGRTLWYCARHKSGWSWVTDIKSSLRDQRKELRREALYDCGVHIDVSIVSNRRYVHERSRCF